jgi:hypothetical protein
MAWTHHNAEWEPFVTRIASSLISNMRLKFSKHSITIALFKHPIAPRLMNSWFYAATRSQELNVQLFSILHFDDVKLNAKYEFPNCVSHCWLESNIFKLLWWITAPIQMFVINAYPFWIRTSHNSYFFNIRCFFTQFFLSITIPGYHQQSICSIWMIKASKLLKELKEGCFKICPKLPCHRSLTFIL